MLFLTWALSILSAIVSRSAFKGTAPVSTNGVMDTLYSANVFVIVVLVVIQDSTILVVVA
jgi:hypothetical protein